MKNFNIKNNPRNTLDFCFFLGGGGGGYGPSRLFHSFWAVGRKWEIPEKKHLTNLQAELGLPHMWPELGSNRDD